MFPDVAELKNFWSALKTSLHSWWSFQKIFRQCWVICCPGYALRSPSWPLRMLQSTVTHNASSTLVRPPLHIPILSKTLLWIKDYSSAGRALFESRSGNRLLWLHFSWVSSVPPDRRWVLTFSWADWPSGNSLDLFWGDPRFESRPGHPLSWLRSFSDFLSTSKEKPG
jgi:hypothetical protein